MNGVSLLLDSNIILGLIKGHEPAIAMLQHHGSDIAFYGYSAITRMEVLGYPLITEEEEKTISGLLDRLEYLPVTRTIEDMAIRLRRLHKIALPDAIILATAQVHSLTLLTLDRALLGLARPNP